MRITIIGPTAAEDSVLCADGATVESVATMAGVPVTGQPFDEAYLARRNGQDVQGSAPVYDGDRLIIVPAKVKNAG